MVKTTITLTAEREIETPERSEKSTGYVKGYAKAVRATIKGAKAIDPDSLWGWCSAKVEVEVEVIKDRMTVKAVGTNYLGNCSYLSEFDFMKGGYYGDMVKEATGEALKKCLDYINCTGLTGPNGKHITVTV